MTEIKRTYEIGDKVWVHLGGHANPLHEGTVVHAFLLEGWGPYEHYVVEIPTSLEPLLDVFDWMSMSQDEKGPVGAFRMLREQRRWSDLDGNPTRAAYERLEYALAKSVELQSHYAELLNAYDGGKRVPFKSAQEWIDRLGEKP